MKLQEVVRNIEKDQSKSDLPKIFVGDTVKIGVLIQEGKKERIQSYEGTVIAKHQAGFNTTMTVRRIFQGVGVERIFSVHSPSVQEIQIIRRSNVRQSKLYYLRNRVGKGTRLKELF